MGKGHKKTKKEKGSPKITSKPTTVLFGRFTISTMVAPGTSKRVDILPTLSMFGGEIYKLAENF